MLAEATRSAEGCHRSVVTMISSWSLHAEVRPSHAHLVQLVRALEDLEHLRVTHEPLDTILHHVAVATHDLHGVGGHLHGDVTGEELGHRGEPARLPDSCLLYTSPS